MTAWRYPAKPRTARATRGDAADALHRRDSIPGSALNQGVFTNDLGLPLPEHLSRTGFAEPRCVCRARYTRLFLRALVLEQGGREVALAHRVRPLEDPKAVQSLLSGRLRYSEGSMP